MTQYEDTPSAALVFDSPPLPNTPRLNLARENRTPSAFVSYDELTTTFFDIRTEDCQTNDHTDHYLRHATIEKVGVSYR